MTKYLFLFSLFFISCNIIEPNNIEENNESYNSNDFAFGLITEYNLSNDTLYIIPLFEYHVYNDKFDKEVIFVKVHYTPTTFDKFFVKKINGKFYINNPAKDKNIQIVLSFARKKY